MKIPATIIEEFRPRFEELDTPERRACYRAGEFPRADRVNDLDRRYRWDLAWIVFTGNDITRFYSEFNAKDAHIDMMLRKLVPPL